LECFFVTFRAMDSEETNITIDFNADLGEGAGEDELIMPLITSCNIACGGHYGTAGTMRNAILLAQRNRVKIGAHPSFPDTDNFGRKLLTLTKQELKETVSNQVLRFYDVADREKAEVHHVKLHGALYNYAASDAATADAVVEAVLSTNRRPRLYVPHGSVLHKKAENLLPLSFEAFLDRNYTETGSLVPRDQPGAIINSPERVWQQLVNIAVNNKVILPSGKIISLRATTFCIHGDNPHSVAILRYLHDSLENSPLVLDR